MHKLVSLVAISSKLSWFVKINNNNPKIWTGKKYNCVKSHVLVIILNKMYKMLKKKKFMCSTLLKGKIL